MLITKYEWVSIKCRARFVQPFLMGLALVSRKAVRLTAGKISISERDLLTQFGRWIIYVLTVKVITWIWLLRHPEEIFTGLHTFVHGAPFSFPFNNQIISFNRISSLKAFAFNGFEFAAVNLHNEFASDENPFKLSTMALKLKILKGYEKNLIRFIQSLVFMSFYRPRFYGLHRR